MTEVPLFEPPITESPSSKKTEAGSKWITCNARRNWLLYDRGILTGTIRTFREWPAVFGQRAIGLL